MSFKDMLQENAPPLARIFSIEEHQITFDLPDDTFRILASTKEEKVATWIPPDIALCQDCLAELLNPDDRRADYPFINCTNCGPRFTIVETIPYDRPQTSMKVFPMCTACAREYDDPTNRRFHAQPNACPDCGPHLSWHDRLGKPLSCTNPVTEAVLALKMGNIVAIRGLGGFHLAVDATQKSAVQLLRERKGRKEKPLAIMVADANGAKKLATLSQIEEKLLLSPECPIILLAKRENSFLAPNLAPDVGDIGIMLPYTPLHHLLFHHPDCPQALVMTSGNASGSPICTSNDEAVRRLGSIADFFLLHNREIVTRIDDSVVKVMNDTPRPFRRARGYVPSPLPISCSLPPIIGCGGGLKSTFSLAKDRMIFPSQHIGDLFNLDSFEFYCESVEHLKKVFEIEPVAAACDMHPDYLSSRFAQELNLPLYPIQHHHAHAASVMAEHGLQEPVLAVVLDGTGYGPDHTIWGGEFLQADLTGYKRLGHLQHLSLPGGDAAAMEPWRMGCSALFHTYGVQSLAGNSLPAPLSSIDPGKREIIKEMLESDFNSPLTSSCGRLFDAVASLLGVCLTASYEGQAAMQLEALATQAVSKDWMEKLLASVSQDAPSHVSEQNGMWQIVTTDLVKTIQNADNCGADREVIALDFHFALIRSILQLIQQLSLQTGIQDIVLSGGCLQNKLLMEGLYHVLSQNGFHVYTGKEIPINDGGVSIGQALIGGMQHVSCHSHAGYEN
jgi:hydrogenase maturation protein HypF